MEAVEAGDSKWQPEGHRNPIGFLEQVLEQLQELSSIDVTDKNWYTEGFMAFKTFGDQSRLCDAKLFNCYLDTLDTFLGTITRSTRVKLILDKKPATKETELKSVVVYKPKGDPQAEMAATRALAQWEAVQKVVFFDEVTWPNLNRFYEATQTVPTTLNDKIRHVINVMKNALLDILKNSDYSPRRLSGKTLMSYNGVIHTQAPTLLLYYAYVICLYKYVQLQAFTKRLIKHRWMKQILSSEGKPEWSIDALDTFNTLVEKYPYMNAIKMANLSTAISELYGLISILASAPLAAAAKFLLEPHIQKQIYQALKYEMDTIIDDLIETDGSLSKISAVEYVEILKPLQSLMQAELEICLEMNNKFEQSHLGQYSDKLIPAGYWGQATGVKFWKNKDQIITNVNAFDAIIPILGGGKKRAGTRAIQTGGEVGGGFGMYDIQTGVTRDLLTNLSYLYSDTTSDVIAYGYNLRPRPTAPPRRYAEEEGYPDTYYTRRPSRSSDSDSIPRERRRGRAEYRGRDEDRELSVPGRRRSRSRSRNAEI